MAARLRGQGHGADGQRGQNMPVKSRYCRNHAVTIVALEMMVPGSKIKGDRPRDGGIASVSHSFCNFCMRDSHADGSLEMNIYSIYWACGPTLNRSPSVRTPRRKRLTPSLDRLRSPSMQPHGQPRYATLATRRIDRDSYYQQRTLDLQTLHRAMRMLRRVVTCP